MAADSLEADSERFGWSGGYAGAYAGWLGQSIGVTDVDGAAFPPFQLVDINASNFNGGVLAGWNWQSGNIVYGVEGDFGFGGSGSSLVDALNLDETLEWKTSWTASIRGRVGMAKDNFLFFGTGGVAFAGANFGYLNMDDSRTIVEQDGRGSKTFTGYVIGGGVDWAVTSKIVTRLEYLHYGFGGATKPITPPDTFAPVGYSPSMDSVRAAVIVKF